MDDDEAARTTMARHRANAAIRQLEIDLERLRGRTFGWRTIYDDLGVDIEAESLEDLIVWRRGVFNRARRELEAAAQSVGVHPLPQILKPRRGNIAVMRWPR